MLHLRWPYPGTFLANNRCQHLKIGNIHIPLSFTAEKFRREVYEDSEDGLRYHGLVSHNLAERKVEKVTAGTDAALMRLNATMAGLQKEKEENK